MSNNLRINVLNGFNYEMLQFQVSSAYTKGAMAKNVTNGSTYPVLPNYTYQIRLENWWLLP